MSPIVPVTYPRAAKRLAPPPAAPASPLQRLATPRACAAAITASSALTIALSVWAVR